MILVPAVMTILGDRAWWLPKWLDRVLPNLQLEGGTQPPEQVSLVPIDLRRRTPEQRAPADTNGSMAAKGAATDSTEAPVLVAGQRDAASAADDSESHTS